MKIQSRLSSTAAAALLYVLSLQAQNKNVEKWQIGPFTRPANGNPVIAPIPQSTFIDPVLKAWKDRREPKLYLYEKGIWGPDESTEWMRAQGREWFDTCPVLQ